LWFGAKGDNIPDATNHLRIQAALDYASLTLRKCYLPKGIYHLNNEIRLTERHNGIEFFGELAHKFIPASELPSLAQNGNVSRDDITWSPAYSDPNNYYFRVVDENNSTVLKQADNSTSLTRILRIAHTGTKNGQGRFIQINDIKINSMAWDGNRERIRNLSVSNVLIYPQPPEETGGSYSDMNWIVHNLEFNNVATYNANGSGFANYGGQGVYVNHLLSYRNSNAGIGGPQIGNTYIDGLEVHNCGFDELEPKLSEGGGYGGINTKGDDFKVKNFYIHHNWQGSKTHNEETVIEWSNGIFEYNYYHGYRTAAAKEVYLDNVISRYNGGIGINLTQGNIRRVGTLTVTGNRSANAVLQDCIIDTLITENHPGTGPYESSVVLWGNTEIGHLIARNNDLVGVRIGGSITIKSGLIFNNNNAGIVIQDGQIARIYHVKFWDDQVNPTQVYRDIYGVGNATLYYSGLDFTGSAVPTNDQIRVNNSVEVVNVLLNSPGEGGFYFKENGVELNILASAPNSSVDKIEFYANDLLIGEITGSQVKFIWQSMEEGQYGIKAIVYFSNNLKEESNSVNIIVQSRSKTHQIFLNQGWNTISTYLEPEISDVTVLLSGIMDNLSMMSSNTGNVYWPSLDIDEINQWDYCEGYQLYMENSDTLIISGSQVTIESNPIELSAGWNLTGYLLDQPYPIEKVLAGIGHTVQIVTNNNGDIYWPETGINSIGDMIPGQGYKIFVGSDAKLHYPSLTIENQQFYAGDNILSHNKTNTENKMHYLVNQVNTGNTSVVLVEIEGLFFGDEVGIWTESGNLVGSGHVINGKAALTVWGRNVLLPDNDFGAKMQEPLRLTLWSAGMEKEYPLKIIALNTIDGQVRGQQNLLFEPDAIFIAKVEIEETIPQRYTLEQNFPNPFNPSTTIRYEIPRDVKVTIDVYNLLGQKIRTLVDEEHSAGVYQIVFTGEMLASGVYFYRLQAGNYTEIKKMVLLR
jgi:hypothetical protein